MPIERFYLEGPLEATLALRGPEFHHLAHVLRARAGDEVELVNGRGALAWARIDRLEREMASLTILRQETKPRPTPEILCGLALLRMNRFEWVIEKATELGCAAFFLFAADHSEKDDLSPNQLERLRHLMVAALKQCGRLYLPELTLFASLEALLQTDGPIYFGDTDPAAPKLEAPADLPRLLFLTGPERGFSDREHALLKQRATGVRLHANILRAETAPLVALSLLSRY